MHTIFRLFLVLASVTAVRAQVAPEEAARRVALARRFAPAFVQGVNEGTAALDVPADPFRPGECNVFYDVKESPTHDFLTYAVYHPGDEKRIGIGNHAHDLEGVTLAVAKPRDREPERLVAAITLAHNEFFAHDLVRERFLMDGQRLVVRIEAGSHGLYTVRGSASSRFGKLKRALDVKKQVRDHLIAKPSDSSVRYVPGDPKLPAADGRGTYGLVPLDEPTLARLTELFAATPDNGAKTPAQWSEGDRVRTGELWEEPAAVFGRLVWEERGAD